MTTPTGRFIAKEINPVPYPKGRRAGTGRRPWPGKCYWRAGRYQLIQAYDAGNPDVTLIHGIIRHPFEMVHAWCELPENLIYDGVDNAFYNKDEYRQLLA